MHPRTPPRSLRVVVATVLTLAACISEDRRQPLSGDAASVTDAADGTVSDAADGAVSDGADGSVDAGDTRDTVGDTRVTDAADTALVDSVGGCDIASDCVGAPAACEVWACKGNRCVAEELPHDKVYEAQWYFASLTVGLVTTKTARGRLALKKDGSWALAGGDILDAAGGAPITPTAGRWCISDTGAAQIVRAPGTPALFGQLASTGDIIALSSYVDGELMVLLKVGKHLSDDWASNARFRAVGVRGQGATLESYTGWFEVGDDGESCVGNFVTSGGGTISLRGDDDNDCVVAHDDGSLELRATLTDAAGSVTSRWYGHGAGGPNLIALHRSESTSTSRANPLPGLLLLVRETRSPTLTLRGDYTFARVGAVVDGGVEAAWGTARYAVGGGIPWLDEHDVGGGGLTLDGGGCELAATCPGSQSVSGVGDTRLGMVRELFVPPHARARGGQAMSGATPLSPAPLFVSYALPDANATLDARPARPSLGVHVRSSRD